MCRALAQALCYPLSMWTAARFDRARVVAAGTFLSAVYAGGFSLLGVAMVCSAVSTNK
jgi:hypothetical protein